MTKQAFLNHLESELKQYAEIPKKSTNIRQEKKAFIYGMMTAARFFDVDYEELEPLVQRYSGPKYNTLEEMLDIPSFVRDNIEIKF